MAYDGEGRRTKAEPTVNVETPVVPVPGQSFSCQQDWINRARSVLTAHPQYLDTEHPKRKGWQGHHFKAMCFDQLGRRCRIGKDFQQAEDDGAYPIWWVWPDQLPALLTDHPTPEDAK